MKKIITTTVMALALVTGAANATTNAATPWKYGNYKPTVGLYTQEEQVQLTANMDRANYLLAEVKIAIAEGDKDLARTKVAEAKEAYQAACTIYKKNAIDYTNGGCHRNRT
jgi:hypothetical protein